MPSIAITRRHNLSPEDARAAADRVARDLGQRYGIAHAWEGDVLAFSRPGLKGRLQLGAGQVALALDLGLRFAAMRGVIEREIRVQLDRLFGPQS